MSSDNKRKLYDALSQDYDMGTYEQFCKDIQDETKRKKLYDATSEAYDYGDYAKFSSQLGFGTTAPAPSPPTLVEDVKPEKPAKQPKKQQTWQPTPMQKAFMSHAVQSQLDQYKASTDAMLERSQNTMDYYRGRGGITGAPVKGKMKVNPASGKVEQTYLTPTGTSTTNKAMAEHETRAYNEHVDMTVAGQLRRAGRDLQNLHRKRDARAKAIEEEWAADYKKNKAPLAAVLAAGTYRPSIEGDQEYRALTAAIHQAEKRVQTLQHENDRQQGKDVGFWRGFSEVVGDIKTWDFGYSGLLDAMTMLDASRPSPKALPKTEAQKAAQQTMLEQTAEAQAAQAAYGQNDSFWNRAGVMTGEMLPFMLDFALMGGSNSGTSGVTRTIDAALLKSLRSAAPKVARNKAAQWTVKALGSMPEDLLYRAPLMTNSVQGMKTASDIIDRKLGDVVVRQDGTYDFSNDKTWGSAIWQGEANAIIENYSEMFGTHLEGVLSLNTLSKIADTFGAKRLSGVLAKASSSELAGIAGTMQKHLNRLGVSDYFGEVGEEYYGQLWRTMLNLDDAYKHNPDGTRTNLFLDGQFHGDIWGGMALSMGLMGAGKYTISAAAYSSMKHRVNKTDARAAEIFTPDVWEGWRDKIDNTLNSDIGAMAESIVTDTSLTPEQRDAAMNYMEASLNLRGFNLSSIARQRGGGQTAEEAAANESYMDGYSSTTPQEMNDAKRMLDLQRQRLASSLSDDMVQEYDADPIGALSRTTDPELRRIAADYVNAKQVYDGMIQRVRDDLDGRIAQSDAMIDSRVNRETGMIQPATMKIDDRLVYIVNGSVSMYEDGTGVDTDNSSESIIIRDAETGRIEFADPAQVLNVGEGIDAEIEKEAARNQIIQEIAQAAANNIDGILSFSPGDTYSVLDIDGNPEDISILGQATDENGIPLDGYVDIQYPDGTIQSVATSDLQQWVDAANEKRVAQFAEERATERAAADEAERQADETGLSNPNRDRSLLPDNWEMPYYGFNTTASRYIESERGTGGILYQDEQGNDAIVISAIDNNNYVGYFREYDEQGQPTNRWSAKFQNGSGLRENYRDMMQTAQELLPAGHELTEHTSVSTDGLRNLANQLKHGYELQYDEQGNIITTEVMINMMARENDLGLADYEPGNIDPARVSSEEYKEAAARLIPYMEALGLSKFNIHWEDGYLYVDHPVLRRADTAQQETDPGVPESDEIVLNSGEIAENEGQGVPKVEEFGDGGIIITPDIAMSDEEVAAALAGEESAPSTASEETQPSALSQIPTDEKGDPIYEQAEPGTAWDALLEETEDEQIAQNVIAQEIAEREDALKKLEKQKPKAGLSTREKIQAEKDKKKAMDDIRKSIDHWKRMSSTKQRRQAEADAIQAYLSNYEDGWEKGRRLVFSTVSIEDFEKWIESSHRKQKPFKEYKSVHIEESHEGGKDALHDEIKQWLGKKGLEPDESSRSAVMRHFKIGYNRAGKILNAIAEENAAAQQENTATINEFDPWNALDRVQFAKLPNKERMIDVGWDKANGFPSVLIAHPTEDGVAAEITFNGTKWKVSIVPVEEWENLSVRAHRIIDKGIQPAKQREYINKYIPKELQDYFESGQALKDNNKNPDRGAKEKVYKDWGIIFLNADTHYTNHDNAVSSDGYTIVSKPYTNKQGKTLDTHLVTFDRDFSKEEQKKIRSMAKEKKGWYDRETGGYMLRSREDAEEFAASVMSLTGTLTTDAPVSLSDIETAINISETEKPTGETPSTKVESKHKVGDRLAFGDQEVEVVNIHDNGNLDLRGSIAGIENNLININPDKVRVPGSDESVKYWYDIKLAQFKKLKIRPSQIPGMRKQVEGKVEQAKERIEAGDKSFVAVEQMAQALAMEQVLNDIEMGKVKLNSTQSTPSPSSSAQSTSSTATEQKPEAKPVKRPSKWVDEEDAKEFERLRDILRNGLGQLNVGFPPELLYAGAKMSYLMMKHGVRKFAEYATAMIEELGDAIRPHLKALYNFTRSTDEVTSSEWAGELTPFDEVMSFDTANFDKAEVDAMATAENVVAEEQSQQHIEDTVSTIKDTIRQNPDGTTTQTITEGGTEIEVTEGYFIPGVYPPVKDTQKPGKKKPSKSKPTERKPTTGQLDLFGEEDEQIINDVIEDTTPPEPKPEAELSGDSADYQERSRQERDLVDDIVIEIMKRTDMKVGGVDKGSLTMRDVRGMLENYPLLADISATDLQELVERAMTILTRTAAKAWQADPRKGYERVVAYYNMQPSLNARDSERLIKQQYSTPTPFGYVMGQFVNAKNDVKSVLEPSAGNGALTIMFDPTIVHVNDIDQRRLENLRTLGYDTVTAQNGLLPFEGEKVDGVLTNPPFGSVTEKIYDGIFRISSLEGQMAINALDSMKDGGRAAIIIGGNTSYRTNGSMNPKDAAFFGYLYSHYNVVDVININGKALYARNGTGYDVRMILIDGRKTGEFTRVFPPVKSKARAEQVTTFDELYKRVQDDILHIQQRATEPSDVQQPIKSDTDRGTSGDVRQGGNKPNAGAGQRPGETSDASGSASQQSVGGQPTRENDEGRTRGVDNGNGRDAGSRQPTPGEKPHTQDGRRGSRNDGRTATSSRPDNRGERLAVKPDLTTEKVPYPNQSDNGFTLLSVVPAAQAEVLQRSLGEIGDVDQFLVEELGYSSKKELYTRLAAEQIDSVALAINQMNKGNAFIIGDMTGVGKGRQGAALIRYGVATGNTPIYFTQKPHLFTDNYRDLADIGSENLRPFIISSDAEKATIKDANGKVVHKLPSKKEQSRVFDFMLEHGKLPEEYDYVLVTYSQIQNGTEDYEVDEDGNWTHIKRKLPKKSKGYTATDVNGQKRRDALEALAANGLTILDESHTVGGDSGCGRYMQMLTGLSRGTTFLSATFAKRADNMPIYAQRTAIAEAGVKANELIEAIAKGGVTLQEIMSKQLVESGQMIRRERSFEGVSIDWLSVEEATDRKQRQQFNEVANIFNSIRNFQNDFIKPIIDGMNDAAAEQGATVGQTQGTKDLGVRNTPFASKMYNLVNQLLFALKVDAVADRVIENLRNGYKPVISFTNTMEGFLASAPKGMVMDEVPNFSLTLMRALDGVMRFTENDADQNSEGGQITFSQLSPEGQATYNAVKEKIMNLSADLPISPMDAIRMKIEEAGYSVAEITGRETQLDRTEDGKYIVRNRTNKDSGKNMRDFNSGKLDVLMINKSGSTGISLHASSKFEDQRQRVMVFAQLQSDINDEVQMRGRIDRSGQVVRGRYEYIMSTIPAEQRIQMMFKAKLKSLDANTTSSQKSKFNEMEIVDYLNKYGDEVVWEYMKEHPELSDRLGDPLNMLQDKSGDGSIRTSETEDTSKKADCAGKISRYLAFLSVEEQDEIFKEITEAYKVKIQLLDDAGENDLEITTMPLRAEAKSKQIWHKGENPGSGNAFADNTYVEEVEVDVLKKPMKRGEIEDMTRKLMGDKLSTATEYDQQRYGMKEGELNWGRYADKMVDEVNNFFNAKADDAIEKMKEAGAKRVDKAREKAVKNAIKARANGENTFSDQEIEALADVVAKEAQDNEDAKQYRRREEINAVRDRIKHLLSRLRAGHIYVVPQDLKQASAEMFTQSFGTFVGFKFNKSYTLGSSTAIFATLDGRRKVELALNDKAIETIIRCTDTALRYSPKEINSISMDNWDSKVPTQTRQTRHIITGNLLQALVDTEKGEKTKGNLISFSTLDGETRQGILMSENFKLTDLRNSVPLRSRLKQIQDGHTVVSENGDVQIQRIEFDWKHRGEYELRVPKSKQRGGIYTMHPELLKLVDGHNFITKGNNMVGYVLPENLAEVVDILSRAPFNLTVLEESKLTEDSAVYRDGSGSYSDSELSYENDPWSKAFGESLRTKKKQEQFAERMRRDMAARANKLANTLGVEIEIIEDASGLEGRKRKAKGWYDTATGKITIVLGNHKNVEDIEATMLHEVVAHHGLRELFGEKFDAFLDAVYENAENSIKEQIDLLATKNGWNRRVATEEYLAGLAERTDFENTMASWWSKIKNLFMNFLRGCGFKGNVTISDNELRYVLWMSWKNLQHPGAFKSFLGVAEKVAKEYELGVGAYAETDGNASDAAEPGERFRDGDFTPHDRKMVANIYENMVAQGSYQFREATQDSMLGLKKLYEAILTEGDKSKRKDFRIEEVAGYENAYLYENRMSSTNNGEQHQYFTAYMKPLLESVHNLCGSKEIDRRILTDYMMAKHGLERNEYMRNEAAAAGEETERDFAGLCGLTGKDDWQAAETEAQKIVDDYENDHDTTELWDNVKRATTATLDKIYLTGLISEDTYNKVLGMYDYYIPLRGWEETTSDEVYGYLTSKDGPLMGNVFKTAEGRESKADDPIATIAMMADDAIRQGNRNVMKQRFLNFVHGNPSDLVSVNELWLQYNDAKDEWQPVFADLEPDMTNAEVESEIAKFEAKMEALAAAEPDKYKRSRDARNIPYKVVRWNLDEHQVLVKRNGHTYVMTINGNPRAAQALNGLTNPDTDMGGLYGKILKGASFVNRHLSAFYTTRNPDFVMSNFLRDMLYSNAMTWVKENPRYALRFHRNFGKINPVRLRSLLAKWESNNLSDGIYIEKMFKEFMLNGGETGYTSVKDIEGHKRTISKEIKKIGHRDIGSKSWYWLGKQLDLLNRSVENCARFAAFLTSREMGRPLDRSIFDAKEISVNFNKKGAGDRFLDSKGQKFIGKAGSYLGGAGRSLYVFWNAGVQGMTNFGRAGLRNPKKALSGAAALFALGSVIPLLAQLLGGGDGDDDDKNAYYNLPEYVRRSNICFKAGDQWITIPLPIEYKAIYGMGELSTGVISGNERYSNAELARQIAAQVSQTMPLDMLEGGGGISPFIPSAVKPFTEAYIMNKGWTGLPVYKDTPFNKNDPEWTKAYQSADQHLVGFAKWLNETSGGDDFKKGAIDINPAKLEYLLNGTFGGMMTFPMKVKKTGEAAFGDREFEWRNMPLVNRVVKSGDERTANRKLQNEYFKYKKEAEETDRLRKKYENAADEGILAYAEKIDFLYNSDEYLRYEIYKKFESEINAIHEEIKAETDPETKKDLQAELFVAMRELVDELHEVGK